MEQPELFFCREILSFYQGPLWYEGRDQQMAIVLLVLLLLLLQTYIGLIRAKQITQSSSVIG